MIKVEMSDGIRPLQFWRNIMTACGLYDDDVDQAEYERNVSAELAKFGGDACWDNDDFIEFPDQDSLTQFLLTWS